MMNLGGRLKKLESRANLATGPLLPIGAGIALSAAEMRKLLSAIDGKTRGLPSVAHEDRGGTSW